jgi:hypothetical protein
VVPSALRTLSVVTLLSAVSGSVVLLDGGSDHSTADAATTAAPAADKTETANIALADLMASRVPTQRAEEDNLRAGQVALATDRRQAAQKAAAEAKRKAEQKAKAKAAAEAARKARAKAEKAAAAARHQRATHAAASRSFSGDPRSIARALLSSHGWSSSQFSCLNSLWERESGWNYRAYNASSGAYGIPQALPGSKMGSVASDWRTNPATQIKWGLNYIADRYSSPCGAWAHSESSGWY